MTEQTTPLRDEQLLSKKATADLVCLSVSTIERMVKAGDFCAPIKTGRRRVAFRRRDVRAWLASR
jgi:predicted DNA-binding transcriptional regulator AlpA